MMACPIQEKLNAINQDDTYLIHRMSGFCQERYFESLPGFIDVAVMTTHELDEASGVSKIVVLDEPHHIAVPICQLSLPTQAQLEEFSSLTIVAQTNHLGDIEKLVNDLELLIVNFELSQPSDLESMNAYTSKSQ